MNFLRVVKRIEGHENNSYALKYMAALTKVMMLDPIASLTTPSLFKNFSADMVHTHTHTHT
jgi:hypothetical protein